MLFSTNSSHCDSIVKFQSFHAWFNSIPRFNSNSLVPKYVPCMIIWNDFASGSTLATMNDMKFYLGKWNISFRCECNIRFHVTDHMVLLLVNIEYPINELCILQNSFQSFLLSSIGINHVCDLWFRFKVFCDVLFGHISCLSSTYYHDLLFAVPYSEYTQVLMHTMTSLFHNIGLDFLPPVMAWLKLFSDWLFGLVSPHNFRSRPWTALLLIMSLEFQIFCDFGICRYHIYE